MRFRIFGFLECADKRPQIANIDSLNNLVYGKIEQLKYSPCTCKIRVLFFLIRGYSPYVHFCAEAVLYFAKKAYVPYLYFIENSMWLKLCVLLPAWAPLFISPPVGTLSKLSNLSLLTCQSIQNHIYNTFIILLLLYLYLDQKARNNNAHSSHNSNILKSCLQIKSKFKTSSFFINI